MHRASLLLLLSTGFAIGATTPIHAGSKYYQRSRAASLGRRHLSQRSTVFSFTTPEPAMMATHSTIGHIPISGATSTTGMSAQAIIALPGLPYLVSVPVADRVGGPVPGRHPQTHMSSTVTSDDIQRKLDNITRMLDSMPKQRGTPTPRCTECKERDGGGFCKW